MKIATAAGALLLACTLGAPPASSQTAPTASAASTASPSTITVMTYNIRQAKATEVAPKKWDNRKSKVVALIRANDPDVLGVQEARTDLGGDQAHHLIWWLARPDAGDPAYGAVNPQHASSEINKKPKVIFYRTDRLTPVRSGVVGFTKAGCAALSDSLVWAELKELTSNRSYFVVNTHYTNNGKNTDGSTRDCSAQRTAESRQVHRAITKHNVNRRRVIVVGDLNTDNEGPPRALRVLGEAATRLHAYNLDPTVAFSRSGATYNSGWQRGEDATRDTKRLDYIFFQRGKFTVSSAKVDRSKYVLGRGTKTFTPSDHYAVLATLNLR